MKTLEEQVREFHLKFGHAVRETPTIPPDDEVRFRAKLIAEEMFEMFDAMFTGDVRLTDARLVLAMFIENAKVEVKLPDLVDAWGDIDYVVSGGRVVFGVKGKPIADEIHRANMDKDAVYVQAKDGYHKEKGKTIKPVKPAGWQPPQIEEELKKQGWTDPASVLADE